MSDQEMNPYALYPEEQMDRRPRYYDGQFLGSADFIDAQRYDIDRRRRHIQSSVRPGVVAGLDVTGGTDKVDIAAGAAVDGFGRQVVLIADEEKGIREADRGQNLILYIAWGETTSDQSQADQGTSGNTRFHEMPIVDYVEEGQPLPEQAIALARLQVGGDGRVNADDTIRPRAGLRVPGKTPITLTSNDADPGRATLTGALLIEVPEGTDSDPRNAALRVGGDGTFTGSMRVGQTGSVGYGEVQTGQNGLVVEGPLAAGGNSAVRGLGVGYAPHGDEGVTLTRRIAVGKTGLADGRALDVQGDAGVSGDTAIGGAATVAKTLDVTQATTLRASLGVSGSTQVGIDLSVARDTSIGRNASITGTLGAGGNTTLGGRLNVAGVSNLGGATNISGNLDVQGRGDVSNFFAIGGGASVGNNLSVGGNVTAESAGTFGGGGSFGGGLSVGGGATITNNLTVKGNTLSVGADTDGKDGNAGKIKYAVHTDALEIFGAGTSTSNRSIKLYAEGGTTLTGGLSVSKTLSTGQGATIGGGGSFGGNLSATGTLTIDDNATVKKGMVIGQTGTTGYGNVTQDGNDLVVNGQFAAGGSGGAAMYSLSVGYDAQGNSEGQLFVSRGVAIGHTNPDQKLHVSGNAIVTGWTQIDGHLLVSQGSAEKDQNNGIWFKRGNDDYAGLNYWYSDDGGRLMLCNGNDGNDEIILQQQQKNMIILRDKKIGLGGGVGSTTVRVHGTIEHDHGCRHVMARDSRTMVLYALVTNAQGFWSNRGFEKVERIEKGRYKVFFSTHFSDNPTVMVCQHNDGNTRDNALVYSINKEWCHVKTGDSGGDRQDRAFSIIAIGPR